MHEVSFRGICTWCMYEVEILELLNIVSEANGIQMR